MRIKLKKAECHKDWYLIVRQEHDGKEWWEEYSYGGYRGKGLRLSERLSPEACIEGDRGQMIEIAQGIKNRESVYHKRVAIRFSEDKFYFYSPKNSRFETKITIEEAEELADQILNELNDKAIKDEEEYIEDGFGSSWSIICPMCKQKSMFVVRPGSAQCGNCG